ncbi:MAG TPA: hypothetical protein VNZ61_14745 [Roseomonas sp.]|nr:hypothetical protein [Roseomonas sp.]
MRIVSSIDPPLQDEHVLATDPPMRPELPGVWMRRINPFTGRALSAQALTAEQDLRAGRTRLRGQGVSPGPVSGLTVRPEPGAFAAEPGKAMITVAAGFGLARSGEDVTVASPRRLRLGDLPVFARVDWLDALPRPEGAPPPPAPVGEPGEPPAGGALSLLPPPLPRRMAPRFEALIGSPVDAQLPRVAILVAEPVTAELAGRGDPADPCPRDPRDDPYEDWRRIDGCRLALYLWPSDMVAAEAADPRPPDYALPAAGPAWRNRLAYRIFAMERGFLPGEMHPWERLGVPLALLGFTPDWHLQFVDSGAVARLGGLPLPRSPVVRQVGSPFLWQARLAQFIEHLADLNPASLTPAMLTAELRQLPPVGVLPMLGFDPAARSQGVFPAGFSVRAAPVAIEQLDLAVRESASLAPFNLDVPDQVELLLPVPERVYEPDLLLTEAVDPAFDRAIAGMQRERLDWHVRRELVRRRRDVLADAVDGRRTAWPARDPEELPEERLPDPAARPPASVTRIRQVEAGTSLQRHDFTGADSSLEVTAGDRLYVWVRILPGAEPGGIAISLGTGTDDSGGGDWSRAVYWGARNGVAEFPDFTADPAEEPRRRGSLPASGQWTRLDVPADAAWRTDRQGLAGLRVNGAAFMQLGGSVEWGPAGKLDSAGNETVYLADEAPAGAVLRLSGSPAAWPWVLVVSEDLRASEADFGTAVQGETRVAGAHVDFRARWPQPFLAPDFAELTELGIEGFAAAVRLKLKSTNDAVDLGFVRARADIYRLRQFMLGGDAASRLVTSPALADLAVREEGARAKSEQIRDFLAEAYKTNAGRDPSDPFKPAPATDAVPTPVAPAGAMATTPILTGSILSRSVLNVAVARGPAISGIARSVVSSTALTPVARIAAETPMLTLLQPVATDLRPATVATTVATANVASLAGLGLNLGVRRPGTIPEVQAQLPLLGFIERTASVAERLADPPSVESHKYALEGKRLVRDNLSRLLTVQPRPDTGGEGRPGIALGDLVVPGYRLRDGVTLTAGRAPNTLADVMANPGDYEDLDVLPAASARHEADYFAAAVKAVDNGIALMRLVEARVDLYERLLADAEGVRNALAGKLAEADARLRAIEVELAETRHDLGVAQALLAEEQARVAQVNARRAAVLHDNLRFLVFRRPRGVDRVRPAPASRVAAAQAAAPAAICLHDHSGAPEELRQMAALFRAAPLRWHPPLWQHLPLLDTTEAVRGAFETVQRRAVLLQDLPAASEAPPASAPKYLAVTARVLTAQRSVLAGERLVASQLNLAAFAQVNLTTAREQLKDAASLGDLLEGGHLRPGLSRGVAEEIDRIAQVAGCLHASFGLAPPIIRLGWAELLSEFDQPVALQSLVALPRWSELPVELRREQQGLVDWLFSRIDRANAAAVGLMNDLVRVAVLLASHAPVDQIVSAAVARATPARPGTRLDLRLDLSKVRLGMQVLVRGAADTILARAVVEDIAGGFAQARITEAPDPKVTIPVSARAHLTTTTLLQR